MQSNRDNEETELLLSQQSDETLVEDEVVLKSTSTQLVLNSINLLMGMGIISIPYGLGKLGIIGGSLFDLIIGPLALIIFGSLACYSAVLIQKSIILIKKIEISTNEGDEDADPTPNGRNSYGLHDLAERAFGKNVGILVKALVLGELLMASTAMLILFNDGICQLFPQLVPHKSFITLFAFISLTPLTLSNQISKLSLLSSVGILSLTFLIFTIFFDGLSTFNTPGSLWKIADVNYFPVDIKCASLSIGILFVGLDGHAVFPSLLSDLSKPKQFKTSMVIVYAIVTSIYIMIGIVGYLMFGNSVSKEIINDLGFGILTLITVGLVTINPLTKIPLILLVVNNEMEALLKVPKKFTIFSRVFVSAFVCMISILVPDFVKVMGLMGSSLSFVIAGLIPITCWIRIDEKSDKQFAYLVLIFVVTMILLGTFGGYL